MQQLHTERCSTLARRVDVVRDYLLKEHNLDLSEENIIKQFCPTAWRYAINKLNIQIDKNECLNSSCKQCWNKEVTYKR